MFDTPFNTLLDALREHNVPFDRDALRSVYNDPKIQTAMREWVEEYLSPETFLNKDEAALYATLVKSGEAERIEAGDLSGLETLNDQEIHQAIEELKRSTAAIEKQSETLRSQQKAMSSLVKHQRRASEARSNTNSEQIRKWQAERQQINKEVEELSQSLTYQVVDLEQQSKATESTVQKLVNVIFQEDDKLLSSLQKLASDLDPGKPEDEETVARIRELCARLIKHTVEGIRTRLDRIYLESANCGQTNCQDNDDQEVKDLQEELESLYSEILPVAQMSVEQQFLEPALRTVSRASGQGKERTVQAVKYINDCMTFLVNRIEAILVRAEELQCHRMAIEIILESTKQQLTTIPTSPRTASSSLRPDTQRRRKSSTSTPAQTRVSRRRSSGEDLEPEQQLARNLGIDLPILIDSESPEIRIKALEQGLSERLTKLNIHDKSLQITTETSISSHLRDARVTLQILQDSLLNETPYHRVKLIDPELELSVETFEEDVKYVKQNVEEIDLESLRARNVKRDEIIERWSR